jgi:hypothetical protein
MTAFDARRCGVLGRPLCPGEVLGLGSAECHSAHEQAVQSEPRSVKRAAPVAHALGKAERVRDNVHADTFGFTCREQRLTQAEQQVAAFHPVVRVHEILRQEGTIQLPYCLAIGKHLGRTSGSHLAVMDRFWQIQRVRIEREVLCKLSACSSSRRE